MKHLKLFRESFGNEPTWEIVSDLDYVRNKKTKVDWYPNEIKQVRTTLNSIDDGLDFSMSSSSSVVGEVEITDYTKGTGNLKFALLPYKTDDEWFYVKEYFYEYVKGVKYSSWRQMPYRPIKGYEKEYETYYKCDQIEGFIKFLLDRHKYIMEI